MRLEKECLMDWVEQMAESLVYEIVEQMSGIVLRRSEPWERLSEGMEIDMITGHVSGDFQIEEHGGLRAGRGGGAGVRHGVFQHPLRPLHF